MKIQDTPPLHLTYCLNVHAGETWGETLGAIREHALRVRDAVAGGRAFALGLRLSAVAAAELRAQGPLDEFREFLSRENLYVFTVNAFPYGQFHDTAVKEDVYRPDWRDLRRLGYTRCVADVLAALLPEGVRGSISTVPCSYKSWIRTDADAAEMVHMLAAAAAHLADVRERTGRDICLALEPEPDCYIGNIDQTIAFCTGPLMETGAQFLRDRLGLGASEAPELLSRHVGVCLDTAHMAVEFEDPAGALARLASAGVPVAKVHLSSALRLSPTPAALGRLGQFAEGVYLHQVKVRGADGQIRGYADLPAALKAAAQAPDQDEQWRVHFHVPLFFESFEGLSSTAGELTGDFAAALRSGATEQVEIETYTFDVLPDALRAGDVAESIAREYHWALKNVFGAH